MLEKKYFLSLSWMISALGKLKDDGLRVISTAEAFQQTKGIGKAEALALAYQVLGEQQLKLATILNQASEFAELFFKAHVLDKLVAGVERAKRS